MNEQYNLNKFSYFLLDLDIRSQSTFYYLYIIVVIKNYLFEFFKSNNLLCIVYDV